MHSIIISDYGVMLAKTGERLVIRGPRPRLELIEGGPQLFLPLGLNHQRPTLTVVTSDGIKTPPPPLRRSSSGTHDPDRTKTRAHNGDSGHPTHSRENGAAAHAGSVKNGAAAHARLLKKADEIEMPLFRVGEIVITSPGVAISADLIEACCERGIRISFLTRSGKPFAMLSSPMLTATVITRREQLAVYNDQRGVELARAIVRGKLGNQASLLKYFGKYLKESNPTVFKQLSALATSLTKAHNDVSRVEAPNIDVAREALLSIEGLAGRTYWKGVRLLIPETYGFDSREHRGAPDPVNSALNYDYGILYAQVWGAILNAGLEPFAGFLHVDRPGKPSLVLDLIEEFRQPVVDRAVIAAIGRGISIQTREGMLTDESRRAIASAVLERIEGEVNFRGRRYKLKSVIQMQARNVASFVRGGDNYRTFSFKW
jgi:CRISP-associated protein Cas1